ncbi:MAG: hypothetical protein JJU36_06365 [Phycisphaeraceae bacterium]|nr:hypothetical protein [Phycisphaeraceae bacterium]
MTAVSDADLIIESVGGWSPYPDDTFENIKDTFFRLAAIYVDQRMRNTSICHQKRETSSTLFNLYWCWLPTIPAEITNEFILLMANLNRYGIKRHGVCCRSEACFLTAVGHLDWIEPVAAHRPVHGIDELREVCAIPEYDERAFAFFDVRHVEDGTRWEFSVAGDFDDFPNCHRIDESLVRTGFGSYDEYFRWFAEELDARLA